MLSLSPLHGEKNLTPVATISYSSQGVGKDPMIDLNGVYIYLDKDYVVPSASKPKLEGKEIFDQKFPGVIRQETKVSDDFLKYGRDGKMMKKNDIKSMREILAKADVTPEKTLSMLDEYKEKHHFMKMYEKAKKKEEELSQDIGRSLFLNEGYCFPLPEVRENEFGNKAFRQVYHLAARSDAGKSTWTAKLIRLWKAARRKLNLNDQVFIFSRIAVDNAYTHLGAINILINEELLTYPINPEEELKDCMVVFDDIDKINHKELREYMCDLRNGILQTGAHTGTYVINTCHHFSDYKNTKDALNEAHFITVFPVADKIKIKDFLIDRIGVERKKAEEIVNLPSRWLTICVMVPSYVVHEAGIIML